MLRVTIELVPHGVEAMSKTIAEVCVANVHTSKKDVAIYAVAGYHNRSGKIEEFGALVEGFPRNDGVLALMREVFAADHVALDEILLGEELMSHTRLSGEVS